MKIGIVDGDGALGRVLYAEALRRGDQPTAIVADLGRAEGVLGEFGVYLAADAAKLSASELAGFDALIVALEPSPAEATQHVRLTKHLIRELAGTTAPRVLFVVGAESLRTPSGQTVLQELYDQPGTASWISLAEQQARQLALLQEGGDFDWVALSAPREVTSGAASVPVIGGDEVPVGPLGGSKASRKTLAVAALDELHTPAHRRSRFSVRDADC